MIGASAECFVGGVLVACFRKSMMILLPVLLMLLMLGLLRGRLWGPHEALVVSQQGSCFSQP